MHGPEPCAAHPGETQLRTNQLSEVLTKEVVTCFSVRITVAGNSECTKQSFVASFIKVYQMARQPYSVS